MKRREFIILTGSGAASTTLLSGCGHPENTLIPALIPDETTIPGVDYWKAGTCALCPAACGIVVRTREHRASKIEGNPLHPVNRGALCARGQAGLQVLYNPDRIKSPMKRTGERGSGRFEPISWEEAIKTLAEKLNDIRSRNLNGSVVFSMGAALNVNRIAAEHFMDAYGSSRLVTTPLSGDDRAVGYASAGGQAPVFDIANATYLLSFGARFLETWQSPVMYSLAYGDFRRGHGRKRGRFVMVEPRMSVTAANADEWAPAAVGSEGLFALAIAQVIVREKLVPNAAPPNLASGSLDDYAPEKTAAQIDVPAERIIRIAREFAEAERPLAICGGAATLDEDGENAKAIHFLNRLVGNLNKPGGVLQTDRFDPIAGLRPAKPANWTPLSGASGYKDGGSALLIHGMNPAHFAPDLRDQIKAFGYIASFSPFLDETTELADLILPDHSYLESWDLYAAAARRTEKRAESRELKVGTLPFASVASPVVPPEFDTKQTADVLIQVSRELGQTLPFESAEDFVKKAVPSVRKAMGQAAELTEEEWSSLAETGVLLVEHGAASSTAESDSAKAADEKIAIGPAIEENKRDDYPLYILAYEHAALGHGEHANLPWLQELPDPMTTVIWGSWVEINPKTAAALRIKDGDLVEVRTPAGAATLPAVFYPGIRPDVIATPYGQGHTSFGQYAGGRGINPAQLGLAYGNGARSSDSRARVTIAGGESRLVRFGTSLPEKIDTPR